MIREAFEKWARQSSANPMLNRADHNGKELDEYHFPLARGMWEAWQAAIASRDEPVAAVTGYHGGHCVVEPIDRAQLLPVGMALYSGASGKAALSQAERTE
jgi:hypothetical protein